MIFCDFFVRGVKFFLGHSVHKTKLMFINPHSEFSWQRYKYNLHHLLKTSILHPSWPSKSISSHSIIQSVPEKTLPLWQKNHRKSLCGAKNMVITWKYTFIYCFSGQKNKNIIFAILGSLLGRFKKVLQKKIPLSLFAMFFCSVFFNPPKNGENPNLFFPLEKQ